MAQLSSRQVSLLAATSITAFSAAALQITVTFLSIAISGGTIFLLSIAIFMLSAVIVQFALDRYIRSRIDNLYRSVHDLRRGRKERSSDPLKMADADVAVWATERSEQIEKLEERERFRREFIGNLAHELKTPIFNIQGYILTLLEGGLEDERVNRDFLERASNGVDRLIKIVEDMDLITKLESGIMHLDTGRIDLHELLEEIIDPMRMRARKRGMQLVNALQPGTMVMADGDRMAQVFTNLLNNAIDYGRDGGTCTVHSYPLGDRIVVEVADDGMGISAEHLPRVFERFYRVGKSRARNEGGSGLGLAIVKHIIDAHQQTITAKSTEGKGTTFSFTLKKA